LHRICIFQMMGKNLRGELTVTKPHLSSHSDADIVRKLTGYLQRSSGEELGLLKQSLFPSFLCSAASTNDQALVDRLASRVCKLAVYFFLLLFYTSCLF